MNKTCGRCSKVAYPVESNLVNGRSWHKPCFNCATCHLTLTLKNFVSAQGEIYCKAHVPKADTHFLKDQETAKVANTSVKTAAVVPCPADPSIKGATAPAEVSKEKEASTSVGLEMLSAKPSKEPLNNKQSSDQYANINIVPSQVSIETSEVTPGNCAACGNSLAEEESYAYYDDKLWHLPCFKCRKCRRVFSAQEEFVPHEPKSKKEECRIYCIPCYEEKQAKHSPCAACKAGIRPSEDRIRFEGFLYHSDCFKCSTCHGPLDLSAFFYKDGAFSCDKCENFPVCTKCNLQIKDSSYPCVAGKPYHSNCVVCKECSSALTSPFTRDGDLYCREHA